MIRLREKRGKIEKTKSVKTKTDEHFVLKKTKIKIKNKPSNSSIVDKYFVNNTSDFIYGENSISDTIYTRNIFETRLWIQ